MTIDPRIAHIFQRIGNSKAMANYASRLGVGTHRVALERYGVKQSTNPKTPGYILEADFFVIESTSHAMGETKGWAWFPDTPGWAGQYEESRSKDFLRSIAACIGDTRAATDDGVTAIGMELASANQFGRGITLDAVVSPQFDKKTGQPKVDKEGKPYLQIEWRAVPQSLEDVAATRHELDQAKPLATPATPVAAAAPAPAPVQPVAVAPAPAAGPRPGGFLGNIKR